MLSAAMLVRGDIITGFSMGKNYSANQLVANLENWREEFNKSHFSYPVLIFFRISTSVMVFQDVGEKPTTNGTFLSRVSMSLFCRL